MMKMPESERYKRALAFATQKHDGQFRKGGLPYITHPIAVCEIIKEKGLDEDYQLVALFHDLLEDTDATEEEIVALSSAQVLNSVKLLTKQDGYVMEDYIAHIKQDPMAYAVKGADRLHNLRCALVTSEDFKRKYILESIDWYLEFMPEIPQAVKALAQSMDNAIASLPLEYTLANELEL